MLNILPLTDNFSAGMFIAFIGFLYPSAFLIANSETEGKKQGCQSQADFIPNLGSDRLLAVHILAILSLCLHLLKIKNINITSQG